MVMNCNLFLNLRFLSKYYVRMCVYYYLKKTNINEYVKANSADEKGE